LESRRFLSLFFSPSPLSTALTPHIFSGAPKPCVGRWITEVELPGTGKSREMRKTRGRHISSGRDTSQWEPSCDVLEPQRHLSNKVRGADSTQKIPFSCTLRKQLENAVDEGKDGLRKWPGVLVSSFRGRSSSNSFTVPDGGSTTSYSRTF